MTDSEIARALSGVLGERARKACGRCDGTGIEWRDRGQYSVPYNCRECGGDGQQLPHEMRNWVMGITEKIGKQGVGWLSTLLLPDGRWDVDLLIALLEEAGYTVIYGSWLKWEIWEKQRTVGADDSLAVAACEALSLKPEEVPHTNP